MAARSKPVRITAPTSRGVALDWETTRMPKKYLEWFRKYGTTNTYVLASPERGLVACPATSWILLAEAVV